MNADDFEEVSAIFEHCRSLAPDSCADVLASFEARRPELGREVRAMLAVRERAPEFLESPALAFDAQVNDFATRTPDRIGPFVIKRQLGKGGMGVVVLGHRPDCDQSVAIKLLIRSRFSTLREVQRFELERRILARLEHPNVARLIDGGTTEEGTPYLVMERVDGVPIDQYCQANQLSQNQVIELFRTVCETVHHAHENLVIHRDIKPNNILVTKEGIPKLLDFGIAKLLIPGETEGTVTAMHAGFTPEYASPEQIRGAAVTTVTDVFSLGLVLFQLLTGRRPGVPLLDSTTRELRLVIRPDELPGELRKIISRATQADPQDRYRSAFDLKADLGRYLAGEPILASPQTVPYRIYKFVKRNRAFAAAVALFVVGLAGVTSWALRERRIAEQRYVHLRQLSDSLLFEVPDALDAVPGATNAKLILVSRALASFDRLAAEAGNDKVLQTQLADSYERIGDIQGNPAGRNLGQSSAALRSYLKAVSIWEKLAAERNPESLRKIGPSYTKLADCMLVMGQQSQAIEYFRRALSWQVRIAGDRPADRTIRTDLAGAHLVLGRALKKSGDYAGARPHFAEELAIFAKLAADGPRDREARRNLSLAYKENAVSNFDAGRKSEAYRMAHAARMIDEDFLTAGFEILRAREDLTFDYTDLGSFYFRDGDLVSAQGYFEKALAIRRELSQFDPVDAKMRRFLARNHLSLGQVLAAADSLENARSHFSDGVAIFRALIEHDPQNMTVMRETASAYFEIGECLSAKASRSTLAVRTALLSEAKHAYEQSRVFWMRLEWGAEVNPADLLASRQALARLRACADQLSSARP